MCFAIIFTCFLFHCQAQFFIGPSVGINQYFITFKGGNNYNPYEVRAKISPNFGLKTEIWLTSYFIQ